jgi:SAM-dependent methyltransferase
MSTEKPYSEACERNKDPILDVLRVAFADRSKVLEIGSGTGQHAAHFARHLPRLLWQPSDRPENIAGIAAWRRDAAAPNLLAPIVLDIDDATWPDAGADAVFTANTLHIVSWLHVQRLFERVGVLLPEAGALAVYGPFNYGGVHTAQSNARFDVMLRSRDPLSGIRDFEKVDELARENGMALVKDYAMPANNRTVVWRKGGARGERGTTGEG